jgi:predicted transposase/invertase (TIGR01784 family)
MERLNPLNDYLFLKLMGEEGDEEQCLAFLNAVLCSKSKRPVKLIKILENKTFTADVIGEKTNILDVRVETDAGEKINIEVQLKDLHNMEKRTLLHWGREFSKGISAGDDYKELPKVITINIVNFDNIKLDDFHTCFHLWEDDHRDYLLTDVLEIHFINMVKFRKLTAKDIVNHPLERWMTYLDVTTPQEVIQEVIQMDAAINKANERLNFVSQDKEFLRNYHMREMALSDWTTGVNTAFEKGIEKGREMAMSDWTTGVNTAIEKNRIEIAINLLHKGMSVEFIQETTGLDMETIQSLA